MYHWRAIKFLQCPVVQDTEATINLWYQTYHEYAKLHGVRIECTSEIKEWFSRVQAVQPSQLKSRFEPCIGLTIGAAESKSNTSWPLSSIDLWYSEIPRLEWEFREALRPILRRQFMRYLLRCESIHLAVNNSLGIYMGWNYAVYAWIKYERANCLYRKIDRDLNEQCSEISGFLASARSFAETHGQIKRITIRSRRDRRNLEEMFHELKE